MKVKDLTEAKRAPTDTGYYTPGYDEDSKFIIGELGDWLRRLNATKDDVKSAVQKAKSLPSYKALTDAEFVDKSTPGELKNGTFSFLKPHRTSDDQKYKVYAHGQIRSSASNRYGDGAVPTRLKSPKPRLVAGNPVESLVKIYDGAFKELITKVEKIQKKKKVDEATLSERSTGMFKMTVARRDHATNSREIDIEALGRLKPTFMTNAEKAAVQRLDVGGEADFTHMDGDTRVKVNVKRVK